MASMRLALVGDVVVSRRKGAERLFSAVAPALRSADVAFFNNGTPYAGIGSPHIFAAPPHDPESMEALRSAGFHACSMANSQCLVWGADAMEECIRRLRGMDIAVCGAGNSKEEAVAPVVMSRSGVRVAFLGYNCLGPRLFRAEGDKPGCATVQVHTHYEPYEFIPGAPGMAFTRAYGGDLQEMADHIRRVRDQVDAVIVYYAWGLHFTRAVVCDYQFEVAHAAIDAGAAAVVGTGTQVLKGVEVYKGRPIFYSLGNFSVARVGYAKASHDEAKGRSPRSLKTMYDRVYGRLPRRETDRSMIAQLEITDSGAVRRAAYTPVLVASDGTPRVIEAADPAWDATFRYVSDISMEAGLDTVFTRSDGEVQVGPGTLGWRPRSSALLTP